MRKKKETQPAISIDDARKMVAKAEQEQKKARQQRAEELLKKFSEEAKAEGYAFSVMGSFQGSRMRVGVLLVDINNGDTPKS